MDCLPPVSLLDDVIWVSRKISTWWWMAWK